MNIRSLLVAGLVLGSVNVAFATETHKATEVAKAAEAAATTPAATTATTATQTAAATPVAATSLVQSVKNFANNYVVSPISTGAANVKDFYWTSAKLDATTAAKYIATVAVAYAAYQAYVALSSNEEENDNN